MERTAEEALLSNCLLRTFRKSCAKVGVGRTTRTEAVSVGKASGRNNSEYSIVASFINLAAGWLGAGWAQTLRTKCAAALRRQQ